MFPSIFADGPSRALGLKMQQLPGVSVEILMHIWGSLRYVVGKNLYLSAYAGNGHYNDMDMMVIGFRNDSKVGGQGLTPTEEEAHFGLWCIMSSPLLIGCNLETCRILRSNC